jgi:hypothetical protein
MGLDYWRTYAPLHRVGVKSTTAFPRSLPRFQLVQLSAPTGYGITRPHSGKASSH